MYLINKSSLLYILKEVDTFGLIASTIILSPRNMHTYIHGRMIRSVYSSTTRHKWKATTIQRHIMHHPRNEQPTTLKGGDTTLVVFQIRLQQRRGSTLHSWGCSSTTQVRQIDHHTVQSQSASQPLQLQVALDHVKLPSRLFFFFRYALVSCNNNIQRTE